MRQCSRETSSSSTITLQPGARPNVSGVGPRAYSAPGEKPSSATSFILRLGRADDKGVRVDEGERGNHQDEPQEDDDRRPAAQPPLLPLCPSRLRRAGADRLAAG